MSARSEAARDAVGPSLEDLIGPATLVGPAALCRAHGELSAADAAALEGLVGWLASLELAWFFGEWTDRMRLRRQAPAVPDDPARLVCARWFGAGGDLELWRDGERFRWRFVGPGGTPLPPGARPMDGELRRGPDATALLWPRDDARVLHAGPEAVAELRPKHGTPLELRYRRYYDHGVLAAVWYSDIVEVAPEEA